ncbi:MAG: YceI family protein [Bdellovibrionales bacterium]|nr:YceI family protein [Bdellovibrionales bacterium]
MKNISLVLSTLVLSFSAQAAQKCMLSLDPLSTSIKWTAFKTTEKLAVGGSFDQTNLHSGVPEAATITELLKGGKFTIEVSTVNTGNPTRDATLRTVFFSKFLKPEVSGEVKKVGKGDKGKMDVELDVNGVKKVLTFDYTYSEKDGAFEAKSKMDVMDFGLKAQHEALNTACKALHTGKDGVSKTWTEVDLALVSKLRKTCK